MHNNLDASIHLTSFELPRCSTVPIFLDFHPFSFMDTHRLNRTCLDNSQSRNYVQ
mgnify:CR=1 FL=1